MTTTNKTSYSSPEVKTIALNARKVLCQSGGNKSMDFEDLGNGGLTEQ